MYVFLRRLPGVFCGRGARARAGRGPLLALRRKRPRRSERLRGGMSARALGRGVERIGGADESARRRTPFGARAARREPTRVHVALTQGIVTNANRPEGPHGRRLNVLLSFAGIGTRAATGSLRATWGLFSGARGFRWADRSSRCRARPCWAAGRASRRRARPCWAAARSSRRASTATSSSLASGSEASPSASLTKSMETAK